MSIFDATALVWLASIVLVTVVGFFCGRTTEALHMGIVLGPVGLVPAVVMISQGRKNPNEESLHVGIDPSEHPSERPMPATTASEPRLQRAA